MGTHPIFESDFDCLTEMSVESETEVEPPPVPMEDEQQQQQDGDVDGPPAPKKRKAVNANELTLLENLPAADRYEKSYMHRAQIVFTTVTKSHFIITCSIDGHVKFWKKQDGGIEFVKDYRAHLGDITAVDASPDGLRFATCALDQKVKVFDVINFDMINMIDLGYTPSHLKWVYSGGSIIMKLAVVEKDSNKITIYDSTNAKGTEPLAKVTTGHAPQATITSLAFCARLNIALSTDTQGMLEFWSTKDGYAYPESMFDFKYKMKTDLYELAKNKSFAIQSHFNHDGSKFVVYGSDRIIRVFKTRTGKVWRQFNEKLKAITEIQNRDELLNEMEFGRRMAIEKDLMKSDNFRRSMAIFDETGKFLLYSTLLGIRVISLRTGACVKIIGLTDSMRFLSIALFQGSLTEESRKAALTLEMKGASNPTLSHNALDPTIYATAYKKGRFYCFSSREIDTELMERDVFNEKPTKEETMAAQQTAQARRLASEVVLRTSQGDVYLRLFKDKCPKTVENFVVHVRNGYYNGHIFHRVIKGFMVQTGCPKGTGTGGESIWGGEFEDELVPDLKHKKPFMLSMANAGPNTNGSQFFITVCPCPWLDNKHTIFGEVYRGMEIVLKISQSSVNAKTDKPWEDITIISATVVN